MNNHDCGLPVIGEADLCILSGKLPVLRRALELAQQGEEDNSGGKGNLSGGGYLPDLPISPDAGRVRLFSGRDKNRKTYAAEAG